MTEAEFQKLRAKHKKWFGVFDGSDWHLTIDAASTEAWKNGFRYGDAIGNLAQGGKNPYDRLVQYESYLLWQKGLTSGIESFYDRNPGLIEPGLIDGANGAV